MKFEHKKREKFNDILLELARSEDLLKSKSARLDMYKRFEELYCTADNGEHFRHFYSDVFETLLSVKKGMKSGTIEVLGQNMKILYEQYEPISKDISKELRKLYDHVSLDMARMNYSDGGDKDISQEPAIQDIKTRVDVLREEINLARTEQERVKKELSSQQREYVAILGIFAAVVITFIGGLSFSTSVLNNIDKVSTGKLMIITLTIGIILLSLIFGLFYYLDRLINNSYTWNIKPLWVYMFVIVLLMLFALFLCYCPIFDTIPKKSCVEYTINNKQ